MTEKTIPDPAVIERDGQFNRYTIDRATPSSDGTGWLLHFVGGAGTFCTNELCSRPPVAGESARLYGRGFAWPVRGIVIDGRVYRYEPEAKAPGKTVEDLKQLAARLADAANAAGCRAVIVAVSVDQIDPAGKATGHSVYGYAHRGPCLDLDGLARRITQATDANWRHSLTPDTLSDSVMRGTGGMSTSAPSNATGGNGGTSGLPADFGSGGGCFPGGGTVGHGGNGGAA